MSESLTDKVRKLEDEHFSAIEKTRIEDFDQEFIFEAHRFHGALGAVTSIARSLSSKMIEGLMLVEDKKYYLAWGYTRFADYLNSDEVPDLSKTKYYDLKALLLSEGADAFDVFSGKKIPISTRKLLAAKGVEISVDGDDLVIADRRVPVTDRAAMKELVDTVHEVLRERDEREEAKDKKIAKQAEIIDRGTDEYEELRRNYDKLRTGDPYDEALAHAVYSLLELQEQVGHLDDAAKPEKGKIAVETLWSVMLKLKDSYGLNTPLTEPPNNPQSAIRNPQSAVAAVLAGDDDFGDEQEGN